MEFNKIKGVGDKRQSFSFVTDPFIFFVFCEQPLDLRKSSINFYYTFIDKALPPMTRIEQRLAYLYDDQRSPAIASGLMFTRVVR